MTDLQEATDADLDVDELGSQIVGLAGRVAAATCRWLLLVAEFDGREGYTRSNLASTARWLSHSCGISHRTVADLIGIAEHGTVGQLETVVRALRTVEQNETGSPDAGEYVRQRWASRTSHWRMTTRLDPERGALVEHALAAVAEAEGITRAAALVRLAEIAVAALNHSTDGPPRGLRGHERAAVLLHVQAAAVPQPSEQQPGPSVDESEAARSRERASRPFAWLDDGPGLPRPVVERLLCACRVRPVVHDPDGSVLDLGRTRRVVDDRMFRALLLRDTHCAHPGCTSRHKLEAHHVRRWLYGGRTDMANLVLLCEVHHHKHHDGEFGIHRVGSPHRGRFVFTRPDGVELHAHVDPSVFIDPTLPPVETDFLHIPDSAVRSKTIGDRLDRAWAVAVLAWRRADHREVHRTAA